MELQINTLIASAEKVLNKFVADALPVTQEVLDLALNVRTVAKEADLWLPSHEATLNSNFQTLTGSPAPTAIPASPAAQAEPVPAPAPEPSKDAAPAPAPEAAQQSGEQSGTGTQS